MGMTKGDLFTPAQVAAVLCLSDDKVRRDIKVGLMTGTDINAGYGRENWRLTRADILAYVDRVEKNA
jgi:hypothetical protein